MMEQNIQTYIKPGEKVQAMVSPALVRHDSQLGTVDMDAQADFDDTYTVTDYDRDYQVYLYRYQADGLLYTFYSPAAGAENFVMYAIETA